MHLFLTGVLPFLAHNHASAVAFLTCRYHNFHASIIPEFLSHEKRVRKFCEARQVNQLAPVNEKQYLNLYNLFVQTPLMQFSPSLVLHYGYSSSSILKPLLETKYFARSLQRCSVASDVPLTNGLLQSLSKVQSLINLDLGWCRVGKQHFELIIHSFPSLETLVIRHAEHLEFGTQSERAIPAPAIKRTLRNLTLKYVDASFVTEFIPHFSNLRKLELSATELSLVLNLRGWSFSLPLLTYLELERFFLNNTESLKNLVHLSALHFKRCQMFDLSFLTQESSLPELTTLRIENCQRLWTYSFKSLAHAPNLHALEINSRLFDNDSLQYLENMIHLRKLNLSFTGIVGDSRSLKTLMQNLFQLEELDLGSCRIGNQGVIAGALYSTHSRLRVLNLRQLLFIECQDE